MLISDTFPRRFATADDLAGKTPTLRVCKVTTEQVGPTAKPVVWFFGARKGIVLSATLARQIAQIHGDDTDGWTGQPVQLHTVPCRRMDGTRGLSIRARPADAQASAASPAIPERCPRRPVHCTPDPAAQRTA